jgi:RNA polymerase sigma-70 factor, ECF subfamily
MSIELSMQNQMLAAIPSLRAFASSLTHSQSRADDLVQGTLVRAMGAIDRYERGTNLNAWLFTILRNLFHSECRRSKREVDDPGELYAARLKAAPDQLSHLDFEDMRSALTKLPPTQRQALLLVAAAGVSYEDAAVICEVAVGTMSSRVNRARLRLAELLHHDETAPIGPDSVTKAALQE